MKQTATLSLLALLACAPTNKDVVFEQRHTGPDHELYIGREREPTDSTRLNRMYRCALAFDGSTATVFTRPGAQECAFSPYLSSKIAKRVPLTGAQAVIAMNYLNEDDVNVVSLDSLDRTFFPK